MPTEQEKPSFNWAVIPQIVGLPIRLIIAIPAMAVVLLGALLWPLTLEDNVAEVLHWAVFGKREWQ